MTTFQLSALFDEHFYLASGFCWRTLYIYVTLMFRKFSQSFCLPVLMTANEILITSWSGRDRVTRESEARFLRRFWSGPNSLPLFCWRRSWASDLKRLKNWLQRPNCPTAPPPSPPPPSGWFSFFACKTIRRTKLLQLRPSRDRENANRAGVRLQTHV